VIVQDATILGEIDVRRRPKAWWNGAHQHRKNVRI
jgi:hypothetical protein